jgi:chromosome segregation ATPase
MYETTVICPQCQTYIELRQEAYTSSGGCVDCERLKAELENEKAKNESYRKANIEDCERFRRYGDDMLDEIDKLKAENQNLKADLEKAQKELRSTKRLKTLAQKRVAGLLSRQERYCKTQCAIGSGRVTSTCDGCALRGGG